MPTPVFFCFLCGSAGKESACKAGDMDSIPGLERSPRERLLTAVFWPGEFQGLHSPWGRKELETTKPTFTFTEVCKGTKGRQGRNYVPIVCLVRTTDT